MRNVGAGRCLQEGRDCAETSRWDAEDILSNVETKPYNPEPKTVERTFYRPVWLDNEGDLLAGDSWYPSKEKIDTKGYGDWTFIRFEERTELVPSTDAVK